MSGRCRGGPFTDPKGVHRTVCAVAGRCFSLIGLRLRHEQGRTGIRSHSRVTNSVRSLDHLVGAGEQRWGDFETERLRSIQVDRKLEFARCLDRKFARRCTA
jgi:hypothetical protein